MRPVVTPETRRPVVADVVCDVLLMEVLNALIIRAEHEQLFSPLGHNWIIFRASFYADNMLIFIKPARLGCVVQKSCGKPRHRQMSNSFLAPDPHNMCWMASRRKKRGLQECYLCALCHQAPETISLFGRPYRIMNYLLLAGLV